jgi:hypothetical protein
MAYLASEFGDPFVFATTQAHYRNRVALEPLEKAIALAAGEPIWGVYDPASPAYWRRFASHPFPLLHLSFLNPILFLFALGCVIAGASRQWLTREEVLLSAGLLLIPYVTRAHEMCMASHARFAAVVFPAYIVVGNVLARMSIVSSGAIIAVLAAFMLAFSAMFSAGYPFY